MKYNISVGQKNFEIEVGEVGEGSARVVVNGVTHDVRFEHCEVKTAVSIPQAAPRASAPAAPAPKPVSTPPSATISVSAPATVSCENVIRAPIPGLIVNVNVNVGDTVACGQTVVIMEAMKMENRISSSVSGTVKEIRVQKGAQVMTGDVIMVIE